MGSVTSAFELFILAQTGKCRSPDNKENASGTNPWDFWETAGSAINPEDSL